MAAQTRYDEYADAVGMSMVEIGEVATMRRFGCSRGFARYHGQKAVDPSFHSGKWGGAQGRRRFSDEVEQVLRFLLWQEVKADPLRTLRQFALVLQCNGWNVNVDWVKRTFASWGVSRQRPNYRNLNKYTTSNIIYYRCSPIPPATPPFSVLPLPSLVWL
jgi:hypothetical protein